MLQGNKGSVKAGQIVQMTKKYGTTGFMYTEYPHKRFWPQQSTDQEFKNVLKERCQSEPDVPMMLYVHIPYCQQLCWFCTCHMSITQNYEKIPAYLKYLYREIDLLRDFLKVNDIRINFQEIHLGGGSPTFLNEEDFSVLVAKLATIADISNLAEFALEIDPRFVDEKRMEFYARKGISRISFGIQDFDLKVQQAVNRVQPAELTEKLITPPLRRLFKNGVNFDILCGLPHQTSASMKKTCERIVSMSPDRICLNYMHFSPELAKHQTMMMDGREGRPDRLPDYTERKAIFTEALQYLTTHGYMRTGYDHFAKPTDANAQATQKGQANWNTLGTTPGRVFDVIGIGVSSMSTIGDAYFQVFYELADYEEALAAGRFPVYRGHRLTRDDVIRRQVIQSLRSFFAIQFSAVKGIEFRNYFAKELEHLQEFVRDGIVEIGPDKIVITELGHQFANIVCRVFDRYYEGEKFNSDMGERTDDQTPVPSAVEPLKNRRTG